MLKIDPNVILSEIEVAALATIANTVTTEAAKLGPALSGLGDSLVGFVKGALAGNLSPAQYAQLEVAWQADIDETAKNMAAPESPTSGS